MDVRKKIEGTFGLKTFETNLYSFYDKYINLYNNKLLT